MRKNRFGANILLAVSISYIGYAASFMSSILVARLLGPEGKGIFSLFIETTFGIVLFSSLGIGNGQIYEATRNHKNMKHFMPNAFVFSFTVSIVVALVYYLTGFYLKLKIVTVLSLSNIVLAIIVIPIMTMIMFQRQFLLANHNYKLAKANYASSMLIPMLAYYLIYMLGDLNISNLIISFVSGQFLCFFIFQGLILKFGNDNGGFSIDLAKKSVRFGIWQYLSDLCLFLIRRLDFFLVLWMLGKSGLGIYSVAVSLAEIISRLTHEVGTILFPVFSSGKIPQGRAAPLLRKIIFIMLMVTGILALLSRPLILIIFGKQFSQAIAAFQILLIGTLALSTVDVTWTHAFSLGKVKLGIPIFGLGAILDLILNLILIPIFGVVGASIASTISYWVAAILFLIHFCHKEECSIRGALIPTTGDIRTLISGIKELPKIVFKQHFAG
jgi:O-antigen/teichoic acid export membrane protein